MPDLVVDAALKREDTRQFTLAADDVPTAVARWIRILDAAVYAVAGAAFVVQLVVVCVNVIMRTWFSRSLSWEFEIGQATLNILTFVGGAVALRVGYHLPVEFIVDRLSRKGQSLAATVANAIILVTSLATVALSVPKVIDGWNQRTPELGLHVTWLVLPLTLGMALVAWYAALNLYRIWRSSGSWLSLLLIVPALIAAGAVAFTAYSGANVSGAPLFAIVALTLVAMVAAAVPIGFVLLATTIVALDLSGLAQAIIVPARMYDGANNFVLLAVPFFVFAGALLTHTGLSARISQLMHYLVDWMPGGDYIAIVGMMYVFSGISGSKPADMAAVGSTLSDVVDRRGHDRSEAAAVLAASAVMGETIPPSLALIIMGSITTVSTGALLLGGITPAVVLAGCLIALIMIRVTLRHEPRGNVDFAGFLPTALAALPALGMPLIIVVGIVGGIATPTEVSGFAVVYGLLIAGVGYRVGISALWGGLRASIELSGMILFVVSTAYAFSWFLTAELVPQSLASAVATYADNRLIFMLLSIGLLIVLGSLLEGMPALIVLAPLLVPVAQQVGIDPVQYSIVLIISLGIGAFSPPIGLGLYISAAITKSRINLVSVRVLPYLAVLLAGVVVIALVPPITVALPHALTELGRAMHH